MFRAPLDRLMAKISPEPNSGCWLWTAALNEKGYGRFDRELAHRAAYRMIVGDNPPCLDHLCRVRCCVNPAHLEPVTPAENLHRGIGAAVTKERHAMKTHCPRGHFYDEANTGTSPLAGYRVRYCKSCKRENSRVRRALRAA